jgi:hypothetical protein
MNRYQRQKSKEIKQMVKRDKFGRVTYKQARRVWSFHRRYNLFYPCEDCDNMNCNKPFTVIVFCPNRR